MTTLTHADLQSLGYRVVDGKAVKETATAPTDPDVSWQEMESQCRAVFEKAGCTVYSTSQRRKSQVSAGLPDLFVFGPPGHPWLLAWETKAGRGKLSDAQRSFQLHCQRVGISYRSGGASTARQVLVGLGA